MSVGIYGNYSSPLLSEPALSPSSILRFRSKIILNIHKLSTATSDAEKSAILHKLHRLVVEVKKTMGNGSKEILSDLAAPIQALSKTALKQRPSTSSDIQGECQHLLADLDSSHSVLPLKKLAQYYLCHHKFDECLATLDEMRPTLPENLRQRITLLQTSPKSQSHFEKELRFLCRSAVQQKEELPLTLQQMKGLEVLNMILGSTSTPFRTENAVVAMCDLLSAACGNMALNKALVKKSHKNPAEEFLVQFSFATHSLPQARIAIAKFTTLIQHPDFQSFFDAISTCQQSLSPVRNDLEELTRNPPPGSPSEVVDQLRTITESIPQGMIGWYWLERAPNILDGVTTLLQRLPAGSVSDALMTNLHLTHNAAVSISSTLAPRLQAHAATIRREQQLSREELMILTRYTMLIQPFSRILQLTGQTPDRPHFQQLASFFQNCTQTLERIETLFQSLPGHKPGDVLFDIEELEKKPSEVLWSKKRKEGGFRPMLPFRILYHALKKGVWSVIPYFTGKTTHAAIAYDEHGAVGTTEVYDRGFIQSYMPVRTGMKRIGYRPNFEAALTNDGKRLLNSLWPMTLQDSLLERYSGAIRQILQAQHHRFSKMYTDPRRAWESYARDLIEKGWRHSHGLQYILGPLASLVKFVGVAGLAIYWTPVRLFRKLRHTEMSKVPTIENIEYVCSEFVLELVMAAQQQVENQLIDQLKRQGIIQEKQETQLFHPLLPHDVDPRSVHPKKLRTLLKAAHFQKIDEPLGLHIILQHSEQN